MNIKNLHCRGYTIIEILIFIAVIVLLVLLLIPRTIHQPVNAKISIANQDITTIVTALEEYRNDNGMYPTNEQGISALVVPPTRPPFPQNWREQGYLPQMIHDPWGRPYQYLNPGNHNKNSIDVFTYIPESTPGIDQRQIIGNWQNNNSQRR